MGAICALNARSACGSIVSRRGPSEPYFEMTARLTMGTGDAAQSLPVETSLGVRGEKGGRILADEPVASPVIVTTDSMTIARMRILPPYVVARKRASSRSISRTSLRAASSEILRARALR